MYSSRLVFLNFRLVFLNLANLASNFLLDALCENYKTIYNSFKYNTTCSLTAHPILLTSHFITSNTIYAYIYDILQCMLTYITSYNLYAYLHHILYSLCLLTSLPILDALTCITSYTLYAYLHHILYSICSLISHPILYMLTYITLYAYLHHIQYSICLLTSHLITPNLFLRVQEEHGAFTVFLRFLKGAKIRQYHRRCFYEFRMNPLQCAFPTSLFLVRCCSN